MRIPQHKLETFSEKWFESNREEFAAELAAGEQILAFGKPVLAFEDLCWRLPDHEKEVNAALALCVIDPGLGGKHVKQIMEQVALEMVDEQKDALRASYEQEINLGEVA